METYVLKYRYLIKQPAIKMKYKYHQVQYSVYGTLFLFTHQ